MLRKLFTDLFEKLKTEKENDSIKKYGCFNFFIDKILEEKYHKINIVSTKTLANYYNKYVENRKNKAGEPNNELKNLIAKYLGFEDYSDFEVSYKEIQIPPNTNATLEPFTKEGLDTNNENPPKPKPKSFIEKYKKQLVGISILAFFTSSYFIYNNTLKNCIIWQENHFETSSCDDKYAVDNTIYKININEFRKVEVNSETQFFKNGDPLIWYGKSKTGKLEYFNHRGIHPETLKELNPITEYIINKYVFNEEEKTIQN
ncbi:hypothetical protein FDT66_13785 [Polaribacter aestuariivivens]|uniref:Uncharacterized protein n=1 Tax=Polaribacter aestuariivivens TaxID=2304626 RepID=A0A5S3N5E6_9FLAO|nr:hypothetical protein [Polaribacter aestuariivivens]TMM28669.1 hypothetical protein FDT66_13785 [Polaribacter aestuariivivens]